MTIPRDPEAPFPCPRCGNPDPAALFTVDGRSVCGPCRDEILAATPLTVRRQPLGARLDEHGHRLYTWTGRGYVEEFYSVTTILGVAIPKYLVPWAAKLVAELAYADVEQHGKDALARWAEDGRAMLDAQRASGRPIKGADETPRGLALRWIKAEPERVRDAAGDRGTRIHEAAEDLVLAHAREATRLILEGQPLPVWPDVIRPYMENAFVPWLRAYRPRFIATEATVYSRTHAYAGTGDTFLEIPVSGHWRRLCVDYKSGRRAYPDVAIQTAAYARGEFLGGPDRVTEFPVPEVDGTAVLHLTPRGYEFRELRYDDLVFRTFLYAREIFRWAIEVSKTALGGLIVPDLDDALAQSIERIGAA